MKLGDRLLVFSTPCWWCSGRCHMGDAAFDRSVPPMFERLLCDKAARVAQQTAAALDLPLDRRADPLDRDRGDRARRRTGPPAVQHRIHLDAAERDRTRPTQDRRARSVPLGHGATLCSSVCVVMTTADGGVFATAVRW